MGFLSCCNKWQEKELKKIIPQLQCCVWIGLLETVVSVVQARVVHGGVLGIYSEACDVGWNIVLVDGREKISKFLNLFQEMMIISWTKKNIVIYIIYRVYDDSTKKYKNGFIHLST